MRLDDRLDVIERIEAVPDLGVDLVPFLVRHLLVMRDAVVQVVFVEVRIHPLAGAVHALVVLAARQRRQVGEIDQVDRQLALHHLDVAQDRFPRVVREADDVAGGDDDRVLLPGEEHLAVFEQPVLRLLHRREIVGVDVLHADEDVVDAGLHALLDEARDAVAERVDLHLQINADALLLAQLDQPVEAGLPVAVARKVVVGQEEAVDADRVRWRARSARDRRPCGSGSPGPAR